MSDIEKTAPGLDFGKVEFESTDSPLQAACFACSAPLATSYFDINGDPACEPCKTGVENSLQGGSKIARLVKSAVFGTIAGIIGALIYFAIVKITGYEVGLISILVGFMVGKAVFVGSGRRGGAVYQLLAIGLTYIAIVSTYVPFILDEFEQYDESDNALAQEVNTGQDATLDDVPSLPGTELSVPVAAIDMEVENALDQPVTAVPIEELGLLEMVLGLALMAGVLLAMPFLAGMENILGLLIIGFGLYQAWSLNRKTVLEITGPFRIQTEVDQTN